jgi:hypothetical protein
VRVRSRREMGRRGILALDREKGRQCARERDRERERRGGVSE